jgi:hypothetical protein
MPAAENAGVEARAVDLSADFRFADDRHRGHLLHDDLCPRVIGGRSVRGLWYGRHFRVLLRPAGIHLEVVVKSGINPSTMHRRTSLVPSGWGRLSVIPFLFLEW